jgi:hypothetical protein
MVFAFSASPSEAQVSRADSAAVLLEAATRFEQDGRWDVAEAIYIHITETYGSTPSATEARARLAAPPSDRIEQISRMELPVFGTIYGLWMGVAVPLAFGSDSEEAYGAGLLIGGPLGLFSSRAWARSHPMSEGQTRAITWGGIWGTWQGLGWANVFDFGEESCSPTGCISYGDDGESKVASMLVGGALGIATGAIIARNPVRSGVSSAAQGGSTWGSIYGAMLAEIVNGDDYDSGDGVMVTSLIAGNIGLLAGGALAGKYDLSRGRVRMINLGALVGGVGGLGLDLLISPDDEGAAIGIPLVTSLAGLAIATHATRNDDRSFSEPGSDLGASLFSYGDDGLTLGTPLPIPTMLPYEDVNGRPTRRPGITMELFRAKF